MTQLPIAHVAKLARLDLDADEQRAFQSQLGRVLELMDSLRALDLSGIETTPDLVLDEDGLRADEAHPGLDPQAALANAPKAARDQFVVPPVLDVD